MEKVIKDVTIVSLSRGILGEPFVKHELDIGLQRLNNYGLNVRFSNVALKGIKYVEEHPEERAKDLLDAFKSDTDMIFCAVGGEETYRLLPYLFDNNELAKVVKDKVFLGFSDTTINHLMLHKVGLNTFYGQAFLPDVCELGPGMFDYSKHYFEELITTGKISKIVPSDVWYDSREDFSINAVGTVPTSHKNEGFILLQGPKKFEGKILGGCIDSMYDIFNNERFEDTVSQCNKYNLFPSLDDWKNKILLIETSEEKPSPERFKDMLTRFKKYGLFDVISGILVGKPADETYFEEYKKLLVEVVDNPNLPILANINVGHANPRCIIPFGVHAKVDADKQEITF